MRRRGDPVQSIEERRAVPRRLGAREVGADVAVERRKPANLLRRERLEPFQGGATHQRVELVPLALAAGDERRLGERADQRHDCGARSEGASRDEGGRRSALRSPPGRRGAPASAPDRASENRSARRAARRSCSRARSRAPDRGPVAGERARARRALRRRAAPLPAGRRVARLRRRPDRDQRGGAGSLRHNHHRPGHGIAEPLEPRRERHRPDAHRVPGRQRVRRAEHVPERRGAETNRPPRLSSPRATPPPSSPGSAPSSPPTPRSRPTAPRTG